MSILFKLLNALTTENQNSNTPLTFTAKADSSITLNKSSEELQGEIYFKLNDNDWQLYDYTIINLVTDDVLQFENKENTFSLSPSDIYQFQITGKVYASGNLLSLINYSTDVPYRAFANLFKDCTGLYQAPMIPATSVGYYAFFETFSNCSNLQNCPDLPAMSISEYCYAGMFNNCTSLTKIPESLPATQLALNCYDGMFNGCSLLTSAPALPATSLADYCYSRMFAACSNLVNVPELPATTLTRYCYQSMFYGCTRLTTAPELPATTLANYCYNSMFYGCTSLVNAPELPATTLANFCYNSMFNTCTSLVNAPELPATTLAIYCYNLMFSRCTSLTTAPELPATTLANYCYNSMFDNCHGLTSAPALPATSLANYCYQSMFNGCRSLTTAPELPASSLGTHCYRLMFNTCNSLVNAPELPATTLANYCYNSMFAGCTSLTTAPELPATTLANYCYNSMFANCRKLTSINVSFTSWNGTATENWVNGVKSSGTFVKPAALPEEFGISRIPSGWTVENESGDQPAPAIPTEGLVLYSSFNINSENFTMDEYGMGSCETGQSMNGNYYIDPETYPGMNPPFVTKDGIPCFYSNYNNWYGAITVSDANVPMSGQAVSFSIWYKDEGSENSTTPLLFTIGDMGSSENGALEPCFDTSSNTFYMMYSDDVIQYTLPNNFDVKKWHHYVITYAADGTTKIYLDGVLWQTYNTVMKLSSASVIGIGYSPIGSYGNCGWIASLRIYNYALSDNDVVALKSEFNPTDV